MSIFRKILGIFVMIAGVIGLLLSLVGVAGIWVSRPILTNSINTTIDTLISSVDTSEKTLDITYDALGATVKSVDSLAEMLDSTALTVEDSQPVLTEVNDLMAIQLPDTIDTATNSLEAAESAAQSLENAIKSFEALQSILGSSPFLSAVIPSNNEPYNPEKSLADSLKDLSGSIEDMPQTFIDISTNLEKADDNLVLVKESMEIMSNNVLLISDSLTQYQEMIKESKKSTDNLNLMLTEFKEKISKIMNITFIVLLLFFLWLLAAQIVILSQGWELFQGTTNQLDNGRKELTDIESTINTNTHEDNNENERE